MTKPKKTLLDRVRVLQPCDANWNEMHASTDAARFCEQCERTVYDLSEMTRLEAEKLIGNTRKSMCVRLMRDASGRVVTKEAEREAFAPALYGITRQTSRIVAAGAFSAALTLTNVAGQPTKNQSSGINEPSTISIVQGETSFRGTGRLVGIVHDLQPPVNSQYAVIPRAKVVLVNKRSGEVSETETDDTGEYRFALLPAGTYRLEVESSGFRRFVKENVLILRDRERRIDVTMEVAVIGEIVLISPALDLVKHEEKIMREEESSDENDDADEVSESVEDFLQAAEDFDADEVKDKLRSGVSVNAANEYGETALMLTAKSNDEDAKAVIKLLLKAKADVHARTRFDVTPLMFAALNGDASVAGMLIKAGADVRARDVDGRTALMFAALDRNAATIKVLIAAGADVNAKDNAGKSVFEFGIESDKIEVVNELKAAGAK